MRAQLSSSERKTRALAILHEADGALTGWSCPASTDCCRFAVTGREPWVTQVEWELVADELRRQGRKIPDIPDEDDERCPFLSTAGRCLVYGARPLGCRTFFCERASAPLGAASPQAALRRLPRALDELTVRDADDPARDVGARPLRSWLRTARDGGGHARRRRR